MKRMTLTKKSLPGLQTITWALSMIALIAGWSFAADTPGNASSTAAISDTFRDALMAEEVRQDLSAAIRGYESVVRTADEQRPLVATAIFRLGECYRKLGKTNDAVAHFRRVAAEFPGEKRLAELSRQNLVALGAAAESIFPPGSTLTFQQTKGPAWIDPKTTSTLGDLSQDLGLNIISAKIAELERNQAQLLSTHSKDHPSVVPLAQTIVDLRKQQESRTEILRRASAMLQGRKATDTGLDADLIQRLKIAGNDELTAALVANLTRDAALNLLTAQIAMDESELAQNQRILSKDHPEIQRAVESLKALKAQHAARANALLAEIIAQETNAKGASTPSISPNELELDEERKALATFKKDLEESPDVARGQMQSRLENAARNGHIAMIRALLAAGFDAKARGAAALSAAAEHGRKKAVEVLLDAGVPIDSKQLGASSALFAAATNGKSEVIRLLLDRGANVNARDLYGNTPLLAAYAQADSRKLLLQRGADLWATNHNGATLLHIALYVGSPELLKESLNWIPNSPNINARARLPYSMAESNPSRTSTKRWEFGWSSNSEFNFLEYALLNGRTEHAQLLLKSGAKYQAKPNQNPSPIASSPLTKSEDLPLIVAVLKTADPQTARAETTALLWKQISNTDPQGIQALIHSGLPTPNEGEKAAMVSTAIRSLPQVSPRNVPQTFPRAATGVAINANDSRPAKTPTQAREDIFEIIQAFLKLGIDPNQPGSASNRDTTPLETATIHGHIDLVKKLMAHGGDPEKGSEPGLSPLEAALQRAGATVEADGWRKIPVNLETNELCLALGPRFIAFTSNVYASTRFRVGEYFWAPKDAKAQAELRTVATTLNKILGTPGYAIESWNLNRIRIEKPSFTPAKVQTLPPRWWTQESCEWNQKLQPGDVLIVEQTSGTDAGRQNAKSTVFEILRALIHCSAVQVRIRRNAADEPELVRFEPKLRRSLPGESLLTLGPRNVDCSRLQCFLASSPKVTPASDLTQIKILRATPSPSEPPESVVDATSSLGASIELFDGDIIEVPQRP